VASNAQLSVALLTGGADRPYVFGLATSLAAQGVALDLIGSDDLDFSEFHETPNVRFLNLRGEQTPDAAFWRKMQRVTKYYVRLIRYAATANPRIFHIVWNNKFEHVDRTLLMIYYRCLCKKVVFTAHNINSRKRDGGDSWLNRLTLRFQYHLADHVFVHTESMKKELVDDFDVPANRITVIPFGINNAVPNSAVSRTEARAKLGCSQAERLILFFGNITPYKGLEFLVEAFRNLQSSNPGYRLIIAGRPCDCDKYWARIRHSMRQQIESGTISVRDEFIPDAETELYFKAADVVVLPYVHVYQSGVLFLAYSFGLPVLASNVGSLRVEIVEGRTGFVFQPSDPIDLLKALQRYFDSDLYANLSDRRFEIRERALRRNSWTVASQLTAKIYSHLLQAAPLTTPVRDDISVATFDTKSMS